MSRVLRMLKSMLVLAKMPLEYVGGTVLAMLSKYAV